MLLRRLREGESGSLELKDRNPLGIDTGVVPFSQMLSAWAPPDDVSLGTHRSRLGFSKLSR